MGTEQNDQPYKYFNPTDQRLSYLKITVHSETPYALAALHTANAMEIGHLALRVYLTLIAYANCSYRAWPSEETIAAFLGVSIASVKRAISELRAAELIADIQRRSQDTTVREINIPEQIMRGISTVSAELAKLLSGHGKTITAVRMPANTDSSKMSPQNADSSNLSPQNAPDSSNLQFRGLTDEPQTIIELLKEERERSAEDIEVNGVKISGPGFSLDFVSLDLTAAVEGIAPEIGRKIAEANARDWVLNGKVPKDPLAKVTAAFRAHAAKQQKAQKPQKQSATQQQATAISTWNSFATSFRLPCVDHPSPKRLSALQACLDEFNGLEGWQKMLDVAARSQFLHTANFFRFDWLCNPDNFAKVADGNYLKRGHAPQQAERPR